MALTAPWKVAVAQAQALWERAPIKARAWATRMSRLPRKSVITSISIEGARSRYSTGARTKSILLLRYRWWDVLIESFFFSFSLSQPGLFLQFRAVEMVNKAAPTPRGTLLLTLANLLIPVSIVVFGIGFFPYKPFLPGLAEYETLEYGPPPVAPFDKLVFMVVDALRRYGSSRLFYTWEITFSDTVIATLYIQILQVLSLHKGMLH